MLGPYREPVLVVADPLPRSCVPEGAAPPCLRCQARAFPVRAIKVVTAAATLLLLVGSASVAAISWAAMRSSFTGEDPRPTNSPENVTQAAAPPPQVPRAQELIRLGTATHEVEVLWARAQRVAALGSGLTLARATVAPGALASADTDVRTMHETRGMWVVDIDRRSPAALLGLRAGDLVTAINGFALGKMDEASKAYEAVGEGRSVVVELDRQGRRVALRVDWANE
jgi:membrane-associated protease RseP (regulator of RpoE activity)